MTRHLIALAAATLLAPLGVQAASNYSETWSGSDSAGWEGNTTSATVVFDGAVGNPAGSLASRRDGGFDIGATSGNVAAAQGSFSGNIWTVSFDLQGTAGSFDDVYLRYRFQDSSFDGWFYSFGGVKGPSNAFSTYTVSFDAGWSDVEAGANGWERDVGPTVSFAQTMSNAYRTEIRILASTETALAHIDNFSMTAQPVPEPGTWALLAGGLALLGGWRRRRAQ